MTEKAGPHFPFHFLASLSFSPLTPATQATRTAVDKRTMQFQKTELTFSITCTNQKRIFFFK